MKVVITTFHALVKELRKYTKKIGNLDLTSDQVMDDIQLKLRDKKIEMLKITINANKLSPAQKKMIMTELDEKERQ